MGDVIPFHKPVKTQMVVVDLSHLVHVYQCDSCLMQYSSKEKKGFICGPCDAPMTYLGLAAEDGTDETHTPEPIKEWIRQQSDLSSLEQAELAEDLESYFVQRHNRIEHEKK